jgi:ElaB/YqjD/DUF883 family membrane-anchored ribosome-binding protein
METTGDKSRMASVLEEKAEEIKIDIEDAKRKLSSFSDSVTTYVKENPGRCVVGAIAVGYLIGRLARR